MGDLKSVVLHSVQARNVHSSFPIAVGAKITGVEEKYFSSIGAPYSMIVMPNAKGSTPTMLQEEDVSVAYDFAKRYPGYTAENLVRHTAHPFAHPCPGIPSIGSPIPLWRRPLSLASLSRRKRTASTPCRSDASCSSRRATRSSRRSRRTPRRSKRPTSRRCQNSSLR